MPNRPAAHRAACTRETLTQNPKSGSANPKGFQSNPSNESIASAIVIKYHSGIIGSEIFPTRVRARALGFTYNGARTMSSLAPLTIGWVGQIKGLSWAFYLCAAAFFLASVMATQLPETKGKSLD